ncbi:MAG: hypothetical protein ABI776_05865 [Nocardioidaceae bacterium]
MTGRRDASRLSRPGDILAVLGGVVLVWLLVRPRPLPATGLAETVSAPAPEPTTSPRRPVGGFRGFYGAHPLHLLVLLASLALTAYVVGFVVRAPDSVRIGIWFVAAVVAHDLVLFPLYALADRSVSGLLSRRPRRRVALVPAINHLRLPVMASLLLLLVFFPAILGQGEATYLRASGLTEGSTYLARWLLLTGAFFLLSAVAYAVRVATSGSTPAAVHSA